MSLSCTTVRLITILFVLAGILLLKPVLGEDLIAAPAHTSQSAQTSRATGISSPVLDLSTNSPMASQRDRRP